MKDWRYFSAFAGFFFRLFGSQMEVLKRCVGEVLCKLTVELCVISYRRNNSHISSETMRCLV